MWFSRTRYPGLRIVGWGPFPLPGEKRRMQRAEEKADAIVKAIRDLREHDEGRG
jgi:hypothetical protein